MVRRRRTASLLVVIATLQLSLPGCRNAEQPRTTSPAGAAVSSSDMELAILLRQTNEGRTDDLFSLERSAIYEFPAVPATVRVVRISNSESSRSIAWALDTAGDPLKFFDTGIITPTCGVPDQAIGNVSLLYLSMRPLVILELWELRWACVDVSTRQAATCRCFDAAHGFREVLSFERLFFDNGSSETGRVGPLQWRYADYYGNGCGMDRRDCAYLSYFVSSSDPSFRQRSFSFSWNADSTRLVSDD